MILLMLTTRDMSDFKKDTKRIIHEIQDRGWTVVRGKHYHAYPPDKTMPPVYFSKTPSDPRAIKNLLSDLRRSGADIKHKS